MSDLDFSDTETWGEPDESGRPANIPEKYYKAGEDDQPASVDWAGLTKEYNYRAQQIGAADGMFGAPEAYTHPAVEVPEGVEYELTDDDPLLGQFQNFAKEHNFSDKAYQEVVNFYVQQEIAKGQAQNEQTKAELDALGPNGKGREMVDAFVQQAKNWMAPLPEEQKKELEQGLRDAVPSAAAYKFLKFMEGKMQPSQLPNNADIGESSVTLDKVNAMQLELYPADHVMAGKRKYEHDPAFRDKVNKMREQIVGTGEYQRMVG